MRKLALCLMLAARTLSAATKKSMNAPSHVAMNASAMKFVDGPPGLPNVELRHQKERSPSLNIATPIPPPARIPYLLDIQSDLLDSLATRVVVPLCKPGILKGRLAERLNPVFEVEGREVADGVAGRMNRETRRRVTALPHWTGPIAMQVGSRWRKS